MTRGRFLLAALVALILAAPVLLVWRLPGLIDANRYRDAIAAFAGDHLGRRVAIAGPVGLTLWPAPELTAEQVEIGGDEQAGSVHLAALRLRVGLRALLAGRLEARALVLSQPDLRLPWPLPQSVLASRPPRWLSALEGRIEGGTLRVGDVAAEGIDAVVTQVADGALAASGTLTLAGRPLRFSLRLGPPDGEGVAGLDLALEGAGALAGTGAHFAGTVAPDGALAGWLDARGPSLALLAAGPGVPFRAEGRLTLADGLAALDEASFTLAGEPATGALALRLPPGARLDVALGATRLRLDPWLGFLWSHPALPLPVGLDLSVEAAELGGGTIGQLRARAAIEAGGTRVTDFAAMLPGEARLQLAGALGGGSAGSDPAFQGAFRLDAPDLRATLRWLDGIGAVRLPLPSGPVLREAAVAGEVRWRPAQLAVSQLRGQIDGTGLSGRLDLAGGDRPSLRADLAVDDLALDRWLGRGASFDPAALAAWFRAAPTAPADGRAVTLMLRARRAALGGLAFNELNLNASAMPDGGLVLSRLETETQGLHLSAEGAVGGDGRLSGGRLALTGASAGPLAPLVAQLWAGGLPAALLRGPIALQVHGDGPASALAMNISLDLAGGRLEAGPVIDLTTGAWHGAVTLGHPDAAGLARMAGLPLSADWPGPGPLSFVGQFLGVPGAEGWGRLAADHVVLAAGGVNVTGALSLDGWQAAGDLTVATLRVPVPDPADAAPLPVAGLRGWTGAVGLHAGHLAIGGLATVEDAAALLRLRGDWVALEGGSARFGGGTLAAEARLDLATVPALTISAAAHDVALPPLSPDAAFGAASGRLDAAAELTASGYSAAAMRATLAGDLTVGLRDGAMAGFDLAAAGDALARADTAGRARSEAALRAALAAGTTGFTRLDLTARLTDGLLRLTSASLGAESGTAEAEGSIALTDGAASLRLMFRPSVPSLPSAPPVGLRVDGRLGATNRQPELADFARWLAERPVAP